MDIIKKIDSKDLCNIVKAIKEIPNDKIILISGTVIILDIIDLLRRRNVILNEQGLIID